jgi:hypothetical protein
MNCQELLNWFYLAATYGSGSYGQNVYGSGIQIGPINLPVTGPVLAVLGAALVGLAAGLAVWTFQRRRRRIQSQDSAPQ